MTKREKPIVTIRYGSYYPTRKELEEDVSIDATPEELADAVLRPVRIERDSKA